MGLYRVKYNGLWLGGEAYVFASSAKEARDIVASDHRTKNFENVKVKTVEIKSGYVFHNQNGDY